MKKSIALLGTLLAMAGAPVGAHADTFPVGTLITGSVSGGTASRLLGWDSGYDDVPGSHITALDPDDIEYMTDEYSIGVDLSADGTLLFWNNNGNATLPGSYSFTFSFAGAPALSGITLGDVSAITGGSIAATWVDASTVSISFSNLSFASADFHTFSATAVSAVPEPASVALLLGGLGLIAARRARRTQA